jgi:tetratricopeptide (TPR) repeat protein
MAFGAVIGAIPSLRRDGIAVRPFYKKNLIFAQKHNFYRTKSFFIGLNATSFYFSYKLSMMNVFRFFASFFAFLLLFAACKEEKSSTNTSQSTSAAPNIQIATLNEQIAAHPTETNLYYARAREYYEINGYDQAISDLAQAMKTDSTNAEYHHLLADVYLDYYKSDMALKTMQRCAQLHPTRLATLLKLAEFQLILKQHQPSLQTIDKILKIDPQNGNAYLLLGLNFKELGDDKRALNSFQTAVEQKPDLIDAWINLGQLSDAQKNYPKAMQYFETALRIDSLNVETLHAKAIAQNNQKKYREAIVTYKKINSINPDYSAAYFNIGMIYLAQDSAQKARQFFDITVKTDPLYNLGYFYRGKAAQKMGDKKAARADYEQVTRLLPNFEEAKKALLEL